MKGRSDVPAIVCFVRFLMEAGLIANLRIRSDSEPAAQAVAQVVASRRAALVTIIEATPVSSSLGTAERMIQELSGRVRALCLSVQGKWNVQVRATMPIFRWIVRHAVWVHNRLQPVNGCTPFAAVQGCQYRDKIMAIGDAVMVRIQDLKKAAKLEPRWSVGIWFVKAVDSDEHIVATLAGIKLGRAIRPVAKEMAPKDFFEKVKWGPPINPEVSKTVTQPVAGEEEAEEGVATGVLGSSRKRKIEEIINGQGEPLLRSTRTMLTTT